MGAASYGALRLALKGVAKALAVLTENTVGIVLSEPTVGMMVTARIQ